MREIVAKGLYFKTAPRTYGYLPPWSKLYRQATRNKTCPKQTIVLVL